MKKADESTIKRAALYNALISRGASLMDGTLPQFYPKDPSKEGDSDRGKGWYVQFASGEVTKLGDEYESALATAKSGQSQDGVIGLRHATRQRTTKEQAIKWISIMAPGVSLGVITGMMEERGLGKYVDWVDLAAIAMAVGIAWNRDDRASELLAAATFGAASRPLAQKHVAPRVNNLYDKIRGNKNASQQGAIGNNQNEQRVQQADADILKMDQGKAQTA